MEHKKVTVTTIARTVLLAIALVNQGLVFLGIDTLPFTDGQVSQAVTLGFTVITAVAAWWKNNSFSKAAIEADNLLHKLKEESNE